MKIDQIKGIESVNPNDFRDVHWAVIVWDGWKDNLTVAHERGRSKT